MGAMEKGPLWETWYLKELIGAGAYGKVYRAEQNVMGRTYTCAVKHISVPGDEAEHLAVREALGTEDEAVLKDYYRETLLKFMDEYENQMRFSDREQFVHVFDLLVRPKADLPGYDLYIRMELLKSMRTRFADSMTRKEKEAEALRLGIDICRGLREMHRRHCLHRDIKPQNILVSDEGRYKIHDFGTAEVISGDAAFMSMKGSIDYVAPEVIMGKQLDFTVDLYSLGLVLYMVLNHWKLPFSSGTMGSETAMRRLRGEQIPRPEEASEKMAAVILKACAFQKEDRFADAEEMLEALEEVRDQDSSAEEKLQLARQLTESGEDERALELLRQVRADRNTEALRRAVMTRLCRKYLAQGLHEKALPLLEELADAGDARSQNDLGDLYYYGKGVLQSYAEAVKYYQLSAAQGDCTGQDRLAYMYQMGLGVKQSLEEGARYYRLSADQGYAVAQRNLGDLYYYGKGVPQSYAEAVKYYQLSADQGDCIGQDRLAYMYQMGLGVKQSLEKGAGYYRLSADQGYAVAQYNLGVLYEKGQGVEKSRSKAAEYYRKAAGQGYARAAEALKRLQG